jgi:hypothetical protein
MAPIFAAEPDRADIVLPAAEEALWKGFYSRLRSRMICNLSL